MESPAHSEDDLFRILKRISFSDLKEAVDQKYKYTLNGLDLDKPWKDRDRRFLKSKGWTELECKLAYFNERNPHGDNTGKNSCLKEIERLQRIQNDGR